MAAVTEPVSGHPPHQPNREVGSSAKMLVGAFSVESLASACAVVLTILGLADIYPTYMIPIAVIVIGVAMLIKGGAVASRFQQLARETYDQDPGIELGAGMSAELVGGSAGVVLGVLALIGIVPATLVSIAVIVFGGAQLFGGGETYRLSQLRRYVLRRRDSSEYTARVSEETAAGIESIVGVGAIVLGILALTNVADVAIMVLVALLAISGAELLSGLAITAHAGTLLSTTNRDYVARP